MTYRTTTKNVRVHGTLSLSDLKHLVRRELGSDAPPEPEIEVYIYVPSGGDYSGDRLDIGDDGDIALEFVATWTETETE